MLISALPYHPPILSATQTPLSRFKLDSRLLMLEESDAEQLRIVAGTAHWRALQSLDNDVAAVQLARRSLELIELPLLRDLVTARLELRTMMAALRRRQRGDPAPRANDTWGYGRWLGHIANHWSEPGFRLEQAFPWLLEANRLLHEGDSLSVEKLLLTTLWRQLGRASETHLFDFEAVVIYVLRWDLSARWSSYSAEDATSRFTTLIDDGLGDAVQLFD